IMESEKGSAYLGNNAHETDRRPVMQEQIMESEKGSAYLGNNAFRKNKNCRKTLEMHPLAWLA
ncbi:hypothetical protein, partial [Shewanella algae]|uniref:hypothetical protein n=1 Tax=Shewanella algae TaxID=38313 RepID=UPI0016559797